MKRFATQEEILRLMAEGWELGHSTSGWGGGPWGWLQKQGLGRGGETISVRANTAWALMRKGLIKSTGFGFPTERYVLSDKTRASV